MTSKNRELNFKNYINLRMLDFNLIFNDKDIRSIWSSYLNYKIKFSTNNSLLNFGVSPISMFNPKLHSDAFSVRLWNDIFPDDYHVSNISEIKSSSSHYLDWYNSKFKNGYGASDKDDIRFITAHSSSSFIGIQNPRKSFFSYKSMLKTIEAHSNMNFKFKPWLYEYLNETIIPHLISNSHIMTKDYGDVIMNAKNSSASVKGYSSYRDFVMLNTLDDIISNMKNNPEFVIYAGTRIDRRGKYRLIFSMNANFRALDYMVNNGSYDLCSHGGLLSNFTTEGYNSSQLWDVMYRMSFRGDYSMICLDYRGYDTQISLKEYLDISIALNRHRFNDKNFLNIYYPYYVWLKQPKPLLYRGNNGIEIILPLLGTLASGLHGTHSFENIIGVAMYHHMSKIGIRVDGFWANGDDQNIFVHKDDVIRFVNEVEKYFEISIEKSLVGHKLAVWSKLWFSRDFYPLYEIGTFRSIWEREGGSVDMVEDSKILANYCKILQVAILFIRLGKGKNFIINWIKMLCSQTKPPIKYDRLPITLQNVSQVKVGSAKNLNVPKGLISVKSYLSSKNFNLRLFNVNNFYDMFETLYKSRSILSVDIDDINYHPKGTRLIMKSGTNYSLSMSDVPYQFSHLISNNVLSNEHKFIVNVLQGTKSYDGPVFKDYEFYDVYSLALSIHDRNLLVWKDWNRNK